MKKSVFCQQRIFTAFLCAFFLFTSGSYAQTYNDGTIEYDVILAGNADPETFSMFQNAYMILYIRGHHTRTEIHTSLGNTITLYDENKGDAVILNEYGNQRVMVRLSPDQYKKVNKKYLNPTITPLKEEKTISNYKCKTSKLKFQDGSSFVIYYSTDLKFQTVYNGIPVILEGFPFEYESDMGGIKVRYKVRKIKLDAVSSNLFVIPEEGYREVKFEEIYKNDL
jgi:hypothetical protein